MKSGFYLYIERLDRNRNPRVAGAPRIAERIRALAEPEEEGDQDTYGMKQGGTRPREPDWDLGRRFGLTLADGSIRE
jgi:hypothetical protein